MEVELVSTARYFFERFATPTGMDRGLAATYAGITVVGLVIFAYGLIVAGNLLNAMTTVFTLGILAELRYLNRTITKRLPEDG